MADARIPDVFAEISEKSPNLRARTPYHRTVGHVIPADRTYRALVDELVHMQHQLDELAYLLEIHTLVIASGSIDAVQRTTRDIEAATRRVAEIEHRCGQHTDAVTGRPRTALADLIAMSPEPWRGLLDHHRNTLTTSHMAIAELAATAERAARRAARRQRDTYVAALGAPAEEYSSDPMALPQRALLLDRSV